MARVLRSAYHLNGSYVQGKCIAHFWLDDLPSCTDISDWRKYLVQASLAGEPIISKLGNSQSTHICAWLSPFVPLRLATEIIQGNKRKLKTTDKELLYVAGWSEDADKGAFRHYQEACERAEIINLRGFFSPMPYTLAGIGRFASIFAMNLQQTAKPLAALAGSNKLTSRAVVSAFGLPVPAGAVGWGWTSAIEEAERVGYPLVIKRPYSANSDGICANLQDRHAVKRALRALGNESDTYVIEKEIQGEEYRLHIASGQIETVFRAQSMFSVCGNGSSTLKELCDQSQPGWFEKQLKTPWMRRKLFHRLIGHGATSTTNMGNIIPAKGTSITLTPAVSVASLIEVPHDTLQAEDRALIERMLAALGNPCGGIDLILPAAGETLNAGGAILELNIPSGFGYLPDPLSFATQQIRNHIEKTEGFLKAKGLVPVHVVHSNPQTEGSMQTHAAMIKQLSQQIVTEGGIVLNPKGHFQWGAILNAHANSFLICVDDDVLLDHGFPNGLKPIWHSKLSYAERRKRMKWLALFMEVAGAVDGFGAIETN